MKTMIQIALVTLIFLVLQTGGSSAQVVNGGFENWSGDTPDGWYTSNISGFSAIRSSSNAHSGSLAMEGVVLDVGIPFPPSATTGDFPVAGFPINQRYETLNGFYQMDGLDILDELWIQCSMIKDNIAIGAGAIFLGSSSSYQSFTIDILYANSDVPDTCIINVVLFNQTGQSAIGSSFLLDDLDFGSTTDISQSGGNLPEGFALNQNFPNPFNPETTISFTLGQSANSSLVIFDLTGQKIRTLVNQQMTAGEHQLKWNGQDDFGQTVASGIYFYQLSGITSAGKTFRSSQQMVFMK